MQTEATGKDRDRGRGKDRDVGRGKDRKMGRGKNKDKGKGKNAPKRAAHSRFHPLCVCVHMPSMHIYLYPHL